ncbi:MAG: hypothetical protein H7222_00065 [Methylotenera sp.]|nr:hypothetical protein [Oligoflexia bacterium]
MTLSRDALRASLSAVFVTALSVFASCAKNSDTASNNSDLPYPVVPQGSGEVTGDKNFAQLMQSAAQGSVRPSPWAGYWWPYLDDGISIAARLYERSIGKSGALSWEAQHHGSRVPGVQSWWGHCNGWAAAAVLFEEPKSSKAVNAVSFGVAEQKALYSEAAMEVSADFFGTRSNSDDSSDPAFQDVFPNQFFLVLTNYVGHGFPLLMDRYTGQQVWNHPIAGYKIAPVQPSDSLGSDSRAPGVYRALVTVTLWWSRDDVEGGHVTEAFSFADTASFQSRTLKMEVWLDAPLVFQGTTLKSSGNIILPRQGRTVTGGAWRNGGLAEVNSHPDYLWVPHAVMKSTGFSNPYIDPVWLNQLRSGS